MKSRYDGLGNHGLETKFDRCVLDLFFENNLHRQPTQEQYTMAVETCEVSKKLDGVLDTVLAEYGLDRSALIPVLQAVQEHYGYLSPGAVIRIGERLDLPASKIYGVATFYNQFRFTAPGRFHVQVCRGTACHVKGSAGVLDALQHELQIKPDETTRDGLFSLEVVACIGACGLAPVICINGDYHAAVTPDGVRRIIKEYRNQAVAEARDEH